MFLLLQTQTLDKVLWILIVLHKKIKLKVKRIYLYSSRMNVEEEDEEERKSFWSCSV